MKASDVPTYLQSGDIYRSISDKEEDIVVPSDCCKSDDKIVDINDLAHMLRSLRFWLVTRIPDSLLDFVFENGTEAVLRVLYLFEKDFTYVEAVSEVVKSFHKMQCACGVGNLEIVKYLHNDNYQMDISSICAAARGGHLQILQYAVNLDCNFTHPSVINSAVETGNISCIGFLLKNGCEWNRVHYKMALDNQHWDCAIFAVKNGCPEVDDRYEIPVEEKHLELLQVVEERGIPWCTGAVDYACKKGFLLSLVFLREHDCPWDDNATLLAASHGKLSCLQYLHEKGCPWATRTCSKAASSGHLHCLQYAHEHGCPWDMNTTWSAIYADQDACFLYAHQHGCPCDESVYSVAAQRGNLSLLKYLREQGVPWSERYATEAVKGGRTDCLAFLHENGCPWNELVYTTALYFNKPECLFYALRHHCPGFNCNTILLNDDLQLQMLQIMHEQGMPFPPTMSAVMAARGYCKSQLFLQEHGCP